jgi:hypothetical protein
MVALEQEIINCCSAGMSFFFSNKSLGTVPNSPAGGDSNSKLAFDLKVMALFIVYQRPNISQYRRLCNQVY